MDLGYKPFFVSRDVVFKEAQFPFASTPLVDCPLDPDLIVQASQDLPLDPIYISKNTTNNDLIEDHILVNENPIEKVEETTAQSEESPSEESLYNHHEFQRVIAESTISNDHCASITCTS